MAKGKVDVDQWVDQYYQKIYKLCLFYLKDKQEAEDLLQDIFLKVHKKASSFKGEATVYTWIYRLAVNTILNYLRRKKIVQFLSFSQLGEDGDMWLKNGRQDPAERLEEEERSKNQLLQLNRAIDRLSDREKTAFYLFFYDRLKQKEIAAIMKTSVPAVESLIHKAKNKIRRFFPNS
jgi:RNA polymerase sigma-70 factor (ECF subfamily)